MVGEVLGGVETTMAHERSVQSSYRGRVHARGCSDLRMVSSVLCSTRGNGSGGMKRVWLGLWVTSQAVGDTFARSFSLAF